MHGYGQAALVNPVGLSVERLDELRIHHANEIVEALVRVRDAAEQGDLLFAQLIQVQLIRHGQPVDLRQVEGGQPHTDAHQNRFCGFAGGLLKDAVLLDRDAVRLPFRKPLEQHVQR